MDVTQEPSSSLTAAPPSSHPETPWQQIAAEKRQAEFDKIPREWILAPSIIAEAKSRPSLTRPPFIESLLDDETCRITLMDAADLLQQMASGHLTAVKVVTAFCRRAAIVHQLVSTFKLSARDVPRFWYRPFSLLTRRTPHLVFSVLAK